MISVDEAQGRIIGASRSLGTETVPIDAAHGRVLARDLRARVSHPPCAVSAMDGYALRAADAGASGAELRVAGTSAAGHPWGGTVEAGTAVRIFTGAPVPSGADAVVIQEDAEVLGDRIRVLQPATPGQWVRPEGLDFAEGDVLLQAGRRLTVRDVALAAAMNLPFIEVRRRPRVGVLSTGDEIHLPGEDLPHGHIPGSSGHGLCAAVRLLGGEAVHLGVVGDDRAALARMADAARSVDVLITTGGVSVGDLDLVKETLGDIGLAIDFHRINMRPGKPLLFGRLKDALLFGLPGNPVASLVCTLLFIRPALRVLQGLAPLPREDYAKAVLAHDLPTGISREDFQRATLERRDGRLSVSAFDRQDSSMSATLASADALLRRPPKAPPVAAGEDVDVLLFPEGF